MTLRKLVLKIHLYGGLLCFWYLIIFAVSSLHFQHKFGFMNPSSDSKEVITEKEVRVAENKDLSVFAKDLQNSVGIAGWHLPWDTSRDSMGILSTTIQNPKSRYRLTYNPATSIVEIKEKSNGIWRIVNSLHGFAGKMPNAPLLKFWGIFTYLCTIVVIFSIISGIWLWAVKPGEKHIGWLAVSGILVLSFLLMIFVYFHG